MKVEDERIEIVLVVSHLRGHAAEFKCFFNVLCGDSGKSIDDAVSRPAEGILIELFCDGSVYWFWGKAEGTS